MLGSQGGVPSAVQQDVNHREGDAAGWALLASNLEPFAVCHPGVTDA